MSLKIFYKEDRMPVVNIFREKPINWQGSLIIKNQGVPVQMFYVNGDSRFSTATLPRGGSDCTSRQIRINERTKIMSINILYNLVKKLSELDKHCVLVALPCGKNDAELKISRDNMDKYFNDYLNEHQSVGYTKTNGTNGIDPSAEFGIHVFSRCSFIDTYLNGINPTLYSHLSDLAYLVVVITRTN